MNIRGIIFVISAMVGMLAIGTSLSPPASAADPLAHVGIVILHGQQGSGKDEQFFPLIRALRSAGAKVRNSDMGWSKSSYMKEPYDQSVARIAREIEPLRKDGATRIVLIGQSHGANAAIAYVAQGGQVDGLILLSLGAFVEDSANRPDLAQALAVARQDVADGNPDKIRPRTDTQANNQTFTTPARADTYLSYKSGNGPACVRCNMAKIPIEMPMLFASAPNDGLDFTRVKTVVRVRNTERVTLQEIAGVDHFSLPRVMAPPVIAWLTEQFPAR